MANRLAFHYFPGESFLHYWDARCKLVGLFALTIGLLRMGEKPLAFFSILLALVFVVTGIPWKSLFSDIRSWGLLLVMIFLMQAFLTPIPLPPDPQSSSGVIPADFLHFKLAALTCWRLTLIIAFALLFTAVTRPRDLQNGLIWLLSPLPFLPGRRIALMATLTLRFLPLILDQLEEVRQAIWCRAGSRSKNPIRAIKVLVLPLFRRSLIRADEIALSLASRGYREDVPLHLPRLPAKHMMFLVMLLVVVLVSASEEVGGGVFRALDALR